MAIVTYPGMLQVGGLTLNQNGLIVLRAATGLNAVTSGFYKTSQNGASPAGAHYQVPAGKSFFAYAVRFSTSDANSTLSRILMCYQDVDHVDDSAATPTTPIGIITGFAGGSFADMIMPGNTETGNNGIYTDFIYGVIASQKWPYIQSTVGIFTQVTLYGYEA